MSSYLEYPCRHLHRMLLLIRPPKTGDTLQLQIVPAIANVDVNGNSRRYEQYVTPSDGIYLSRFQQLAASTTGSSLLELRGP